MVVKRCLDTYALMEISQGNKKLMHYLTIPFVITDITLAEFYIVLLRTQGERVADYWFKRMTGYAVPVDKEVLREAMKFRHAHRRQRISFFDAVGYIYSLEKGMAFVTGDKEFKDIKGVEFIKK